MQVSEVGVVTITLARHVEEERALLSALNVLRGCRFPVIAAHGGPGRNFIGRLTGFGFQVELSKKRGLVKQVKTGFRAALNAWPRKGIVYTEPDKYPFFGERLTQFIARASGADVGIAARDARSFATFPKGQQWTEAFTNEAAELVLGINSDYCYGPLLLSRKAAKMALEAPEDLGWGWRFWLIARAKRMGLKITVVRMNLPCPEEQRGEDTRADRIYRLKQMRQNLEGMERGVSKPSNDEM